MKTFKLAVIVMVFGFFGSGAAAKDLAVGNVAPDFTLKTHAGKDFSLSARKGSWTVLYFYPKAETPGCTKQACAFRDNLEKIRQLGGDVFGISTDTVEAQEKFHTHHKLNFVLLADPKATVTDLYGAKMPVVKISKRWTFIIDPDLKIAAIEKEVDPVLDANNVAKIIQSLKK